MSIIDVRLRPPFQSIGDGMFNTPGRALFEPEAFAPRFGMRLAESARQRSMPLLLAEMDEAGIERGVVPIRTATAMNNDDLAALETRWPQRFTGLAGVDPHQGQAALDTVERYAIRGACRGVLMEPGFCRPALHADDPLLWPVYDLCQSASVPVFLSFGGFVAPGLAFCDPLIIDRVAMAFPRLTLVIAHGGWPHAAAMCHVAFQRDGVHLAPDLYTMNVPGHTDYRDAANHLIPEKLLFGTAYPCVALKNAVDYTLAWGLSSRSQALFLHDNAARVLGL